MQNQSKSIRPNETTWKYKTHVSLQVASENSTWFFILLLILICCSWSSLTFNKFNFFYLYRIQNHFKHFSRTGKTATEPLNVIFHFIFDLDRIIQIDLKRFCGYFALDFLGFCLFHFFVWVHCNSKPNRLGLTVRTNFKAAICKRISNEVCDELVSALWTQFNDMKGTRNIYHLE